MSHDPQCDEFASDARNWTCICRYVRAAYRRGFNDHARAAQHWQDTHGAYRQHGQGENP